MAALSFITAIMPEAKRSVCGLSHELPLTAGTPQDERDLTEFVELCNDMGAVGFMREDVPSCDGMVVLSDVKRFAAAHPQVSERSEMSRLTTREA